MNNKKIAVILAIFILTVFLIIGFIGISNHIPFFKGALSLIFSLVLVVFVIGFFILVIRRK